MRVRGILLLSFLAACGEPAAPPAASKAAGPPPALPSGTAPRVDGAPAVGDLVDEAVARCVDYVNVSGSAEKRVILEANGAGVAVLDLGNDGDLDLVFAQGAAKVDATKLPRPEVFENDGTGRFTRRALGSNYYEMWTTGLATGDVDGDGDDDLVTGGLSGIAVYLQGPDGALSLKQGAIPTDSFRIVREKGHAMSWFTSLALFDADLDGILDLYAGRYLDLDPMNPPIGKLGEGPLAVPCTWKGQPVFCGPAGLVPQPDAFFRGRGDGTFEDVSSTALPGHVAGFTLAVLPFDADGDGDTDVFVANDTSPNLLLVNDGRGVFTDVARAAGVALSSEGRMQAGMGAAAGDVNRDGLPDFAVTNFSDEATELYFGGAQGFRRMTNAYGLMRETRSLLSWSVHLTDFDGDGWLELFTTNGHVYPQADAPHTGTRYGQPATLWKLGPEPKAVRVEPRAADSILAAAIGARGSAVGDFDLDGAPDVVLARIDARAAVGMNRTGAGNARIALRLLGPEIPTGTAPRTPRDGHGAKAILVVGTGADEHALLAEVQTAAGFQSASTPWLHFGLGASKRYEKLIVRWPSGRVEELPGGEAGARITVREGRGIVAREAFR
ncbi:MAG: CRTAC1 family protein [Planctomycetota bacterium]|nr:CRTAC1 family protein [Planctomycetota bacterium]